MALLPEMNRQWTFTTSFTWAVSQTQDSDHSPVNPGDHLYKGLWRSLHHLCSFKVWVTFDLEMGGELAPSKETFNWLRKAQDLWRWSLLWCIVVLPFQVWGRSSCQGAWPWETQSQTKPFHWPTWNKIRNRQVIAGTRSCSRSQYAFYGCIHLKPLSKGLDQNDLHHEPRKQLWGSLLHWHQTVPSLEETKQQKTLQRQNTTHRMSPKKNHI